MLRVLKKIFRIKSEPQIIGFRGYGAHNKITVIGRVTEKAGVQPSERKLGSRKNAKSLLKRYLASPITEIEVEISWQGVTVTTTTNENGMFYATLHTKHDNDAPDKDAKWMLVKARLVDHTGEDAYTEPEVLIKGKNNEYGIISDIDDTILVSGATKKITLVYRTLTQDSHKRKPFEGIVELLNSLTRGEKGTSHNPIFYVSSSQWNLYDYLVEFMRINKFPKGVLLLKEIGNIYSLFNSVGQHEHKAERIREVLNTYDDLPFVLIGDSGQHDAQIYSEIIKEFPDRIRSVYIRDVTVKENSMVTEAINTHGKSVPFILIKTSREAAEHAEQIGLIPTEQKEIIQEKVNAIEAQ